jgi:hypothetical protein
MSIAKRLFPHLLSYEDPDSFVNRCRRRRSKLIWACLERVAQDMKPVRILDVGGAIEFWQAIGMPSPDRYHVTLLNLGGAKPEGVDGFSFVQGDACELPFERGDFDVVLSNSVIEHVGDRQHQERMARRIAEVCHRYIVQTPSFCFPFEPHAQLPFFHYLPPSLGGMLIQHFDILGYPRGKDLAACIASFQATRMLTRRSFQSLFPDARVHTERLFGLAKSYTAIRGFDDCEA